MYFLHQVRFLNQTILKLLLTKFFYTEYGLPIPQSGASSSPHPPPPSSTTTLPSITTNRPATDANTIAPPAPLARSSQPRPTTGGKSLEVVNMYHKRVTLTVKRKAEDENDAEEEESEAEEEMDQEEGEQEQESGSEWEGETETDVVKPRGSGRSQRKPKKRRRIVSAPTINSDGEEELPEEPGWPTEHSRRPCDACVEAGWSCKTYLMQKRGRQRYACQMCKHLKKGCSTMPGRRREFTKLLAARRQEARSRRSRGDEEEEQEEQEHEEGEEDERDGVSGQGKRRRSRSGTRSRSKTTKKVKFAEGLGGHQKQSQERRSERKPMRGPQDGLVGVDGLKPPPSKKGKGKATRRGDGDDDDDDGMDLDDIPFPMKTEGGDEMEWQSSEYPLNFIFLFIFSI